MSTPKQEKYFAIGLTEKDHRPTPEVEFTIAILDEDGRGKTIAYYSYHSNTVLAIRNATNGNLSREEDQIPASVVEKCRNRANWPGYHMDEDGEVTLPSFMCPTEAMIQAAREKTKLREKIDGRI